MNMISNNNQPKLRERQTKHHKCIEIPITNLHTVTTSISNLQITKRNQQYWHRISLNLFWCVQSFFTMYTKLMYFYSTNTVNNIDKFESNIPDYQQIKTKIFWWTIWSIMKITKKKKRKTFTYIFYIFRTSNNKMF
jgi:hypothetical protein